MTNAIRSQDNDKVASFITTDNKSIKVNSTSVKPLTKYYSKHKYALDLEEDGLSRF